MPKNKSTGGCRVGGDAGNSQDTTERCCRCGQAFDDRHGAMICKVYGRYYGRHHWMTFSAPAKRAASSASALGAELGGAED